MKRRISIKDITLIGTVDDILGNTNLGKGQLSRLKKLIGYCMGDCGKMMSADRLITQHIIQKKRGGTTLPANVRFLCRPCYDIEDGMAVKCPHCQKNIQLNEEQKKRLTKEKMPEVITVERNV